MEVILKVTVYYSTFSSSINHSCHLLFTSGVPANNELNMRHLMAPNGPHLDVILACVLYAGCRRHLAKQDCIPEASAGAGGALEMVGVVGTGRSELLF